MALRNPPSWLQQGSHPAENDRLTNQLVVATTGIAGASSLEVTQNSPTGMSVLVASGWGAIVGDYQANMGVYTFYNDASATATITAANPSLPRIDKICVTVSDAFYTGSLNQVAINVVAGTPGAVPVAPITPTNSLVLATVAVAAGATTITTANITDARVAATSNLGAAGDITAVTAGTGLSGGGTSGAVTLAIDSTAIIVASGFTATGTNLIGSHDEKLFMTLMGAI